MQFKIRCFVPNQLDSVQVDTHCFVGVPDKWSIKSFDFIQFYYSVFFVMKTTNERELQIDFKILWMSQLYQFHRFLMKSTGYMHFMVSVGGLLYRNSTALLVLVSFMYPDQAAIIQCMSSPGNETWWITEENRSVRHLWTFSVTPLCPLAKSTGRWTVPSLFIPPKSHPERRTPRNKIYNYEVNANKCKAINVYLHRQVWVELTVCLPLWYKLVDLPLQVLEYLV